MATGNLSRENRQIEKFIQLRGLSSEALRQEAKFLGLNVEDTTTDQELIQLMVRTVGTPQEWNLPQALAIRTKGRLEAQDFVRRANAAILPQDPATGRPFKEKIQKSHFSFASKGGDSYTQECCYIRAKLETVQIILKNDWLVTLPSQYKLLEKMREDPSKFKYNFIRKQDSKTKRFHLMLHVQPV